MDWSKLPWVDISFALVAAWYMYQGYRRGFIAASFSAAGFFVGFAASLLFYAPFAAFTTAHLGVAKPFAKPLAFFALLIVMEYAMNILSMYVYRRVPPNIRKAKVNRLFGIIPGFLDAAFTAAIMLSLMMALPMPQALKKDIQASPTGAFALRVSGALDAAFTGVFGGAIKETLAFVTIRTDSHDAVDLGFRTTGFAPDAAAEARMLALVNEERTSRGLKPLVANAALTKLARAHSADMLERGYFSHITPEGLSPSDRANEAGIRYLVFGENLALSPDVPTAHQGLMNSPGHRANILAADYGRVGIGIQDAGIYGIMVTQNFSN
ncbi:MAG TPA: CvpA family protein [Candidatus Eisenbacteria bacterium]|nr:CvpA family protein [Candidatus Eisenbacteria bacterium]